MRFFNKRVAVFVTLVMAAAGLVILINILSPIDDRVSRASQHQHQQNVSVSARITSQPAQLKL
ncbi:hypothetical protein [Paraherbaspirillum soli]|uniref:Uncharacterized protein n=1 Tax=Paraherbaspirillum soli TaxID=631222 RepID=A0ABW0M339_9BURK